MNRPSRNEIEKSLSSAKREEPIQVERSTVDLPTKDSQRQSRIIGGNLEGVSRHIPKKNYTGWIVAACLILFSGLIFIIPEFFNQAPKISQNKEGEITNDLYSQNIENNEGTPSTSNSENAFTVPDDRNRATEYRQTEILQQQLIDLKTKAGAAIAKGNYTKPPNDNALTYYQEMLTLDENNIAATDGINYMLNRLLTVGNQMLNNDDLDTAKEAQQSIAEIDIDSVEYFELNEAIVEYEAEQQKKALDAKISTLFKQAEQAVKKNNVISPKDQNAVFYYREVFKLDATNAKAREGLETIRQNYADLAEKQINDRDWNKAKTTINNLKQASEDSVLVTFLTKRLNKAQSTPETPNRENIVENTETSTQSETTVFPTLPANPRPESEPTIPQPNGNNSPAPITERSITPNDTTLAQREREPIRSVAPVENALNPTPNNQPNSTTSVATNSQSTTNAVANTNRDQQQLSTGLQAYYSGEYITAFSNLAPLADNSNTRAQIRIGYMYQFGRGVAQDQALGAQYLRNALPDLINRAQKNQSWAQSDLGSLYEDGIIVTRSYSEALNWYRKAAAQNYAGAQTNLGNMYFFGKGVEQNQEEAIKWYRLAALGGDAIAKQNLIQLDAVNF